MSSSNNNSSSEELGTVPVVDIEEPTATATAIPPPTTTITTTTTTTPATTTTTTAIPPQTSMASVIGTVGVGVEVGSSSSTTTTNMEKQQASSSSSQMMQSQRQRKGRSSTSSTSSSARLTVPSGALLDGRVTFSSPSSSKFGLTQAQPPSSGGGGGGNGASVLGLGGGMNGNHNNNGRQYLSRLLDVQQMDIQSALDQMKTLLGTRPHVVYKTAYYRKQTKNHWSRDDPAFVAIQGVFLLLAALAYAVAFRCTFVGGMSFIFVTVLWNWLGIGLLIATVARELSNRHLVTSNNKNNSIHVKQSVEWLYAFDIHCNAFFPVFVLLYGVQFFLLPLVLRKSFFAFLVSNTLHLIAFSWYWYVTHLGYRTLPFLTNTEVFLFPIAAFLLLYLINTILFFVGFGWNMSRMMAEFYFT